MPYKRYTHKVLNRITHLLYDEATEQLLLKCHIKLYMVDDTSDEGL